MPKELLSGTICLHIYGLQTKDIDLQTYGCEELSGYTKAEFKGSSRDFLRSLTELLTPAFINNKT
jgi:hypothetical protein